MATRPGCCSTPGHGDRAARFFPRCWCCAECAGQVAPTVQLEAAPPLARNPHPGPCRYCAGETYTADGEGPVHPCCLAWSAVIAEGHPCPSCQAARWAANPNTRYRKMPPLPLFLADGVTPFAPGRVVPPPRRLRAVETVGAAA